MPSIQHVLETVLYVDDLRRSRAFYEDVLELVPMAAGSGPPSDPLVTPR